MTHDPGPRPLGLAQQATRFLVLGGANTAATSAAFYALTRWLDPAVAFTIVYAVGLTVVTLLTPRVVFGTQARAAQKFALAGWYLGVYLVGVLVIHVLDHGLHASRLEVVLGSLAVTAPLNFVGARLLIARR
jgi:putative flippase GtrA